MMFDDTERQLAAYVAPVAAQLLEDCEVMATYAAANGLLIPEWLGNALSKIGAKADGHLQEIRKLCEQSQDGDSEKLLELRAAVGEAVRTDLRGLVRMHGVLAEIVAPATPRSIRATAAADSLGGAIRSIPLIGQLLTLSVLFLCVFVLVSVFGPTLGAEPPWPAAVHFLTLLSAAGLGGAFWALFTAHRYVVAGTYDPRYTIVYWARLCLGVMSGVILGAFVFTRFPDSAKAGSHGAVLFTSSLAALLGGYSADAVNRILQRLVQALVTLVRGDGSEIQAARERELQAEHRRRLQATRARLAQRIHEVKSRLEKGDSGAASAALDDLARSLSGQASDSD
jgi:hypothetical protein